MTLRVLDAAEREVADAFDYYESQSEGLGRRMTGEIREALAGILDFPEAHPIFDPVHRKRNLKKFPYGIIFRIEGEEVVFVACSHLRSDPAKWRELLKTR
jgi:plasmid stabilization system protein ParE